MKPLQVVLIYVLIALLAVGVAGGFASSGIVENDPDRNIHIPEETLIEMEAQLAYNDDDLYWRFSWDADEDSSIHHDYFVYEDGEWNRERVDIMDEDRSVNYMEDRFAMFLDDGSVDFFEQYGGFITATSQMRYMLSMIDGDELEELDEATGRDYVRKYLPDTRRDPSDWSSIKSEEELERLIDAGYFLDFWHWKAHRSNPIGLVEDNMVLDDRIGDDGNLNDTNWDDEQDQPMYMFNPDVKGQYAMEHDKVINREYTTEDIYYLSESTWMPYDPDHEWQEGDVIPRRLLNEGAHDESIGDIKSNGVLADGRWTLDLQRAMDTGNRDDKAIHDQGTYDVAFSVHKSIASRFHYTSFPYKIGFDRPADIEAHHFTGDAPPWDEVETHTIKMFYPGKISWDHATDEEQHAGAEEVNARMDLREFHTEEEFSYYGVESEFRDEILNQWTLTLGAVSIFVILFSIGAIRAADKTGRRDDE